MVPNDVHSGFEGVFNSTVEEKRMRFLHRKDTVGVGGNPRENKREKRRGEAEGVLLMNLSWKLPKISKQPYPTPRRHSPGCV